MGRNEVRAGHVQKLKAFAKTAGVDPVRKDDASRAVVTEMVGKIRLSGAPDATLRKVEKEFALYVGTFDTTAAAAVPQEAAAETETPANRYRGKSFLLTYNWDFFGTDLPDGTAALRSGRGRALGALAPLENEEEERAWCAQEQPYTRGVAAERAA